jgi:hypothetical protein
MVQMRWMLAAVLLGAPLAGARAQQTPSSQLALAVARFEIVGPGIPLSDAVRVADRAIAAARQTNRFGGVVDRQSDAQLAAAAREATRADHWENPIAVCQNCGWTANMLLLGSVDSRSASGAPPQPGVVQMDIRARYMVTLKLYDISTQTVVATQQITVDNGRCAGAVSMLCPTGDATAEAAFARAISNLTSPMMKFLASAIPPRIVDASYDPDSAVTDVRLNAGRNSGLRRGQRFTVITMKKSAIAIGEVVRVKLATLEVSDEDPESVTAKVLDGGAAIGRAIREALQARKTPAFVLQAAPK